MSDEKALLAAIWEHPHEDTPRLVYADWLEEHDQPERAEFIRVQCELARLDEYDERYEELKSRATSLLRRNTRFWKKGLPEALRKAPFHRGFLAPEQIHLEYTTFRRRTLRSLVAAPLWNFLISLPHESDLPALSRSTAFARIGAVCLSCDSSWSAVKRDFWGKFAKSPNIRNLAELDLKYADMDDDKVQSLAASEHFVSLQRLQLPGWRLTSAAVRAIAASRFAPQLRVLDLSRNRIDDEVLSAIADGGFKELRELRLVTGSARLSAGGIRRLVTSPALANLRILDLAYHQEVNDAAVRAIAESPVMSQLRELWLKHTGVKAGGVKALVESPHLNRVRKLSLVQTQIPREGKNYKALVKRYGEVLYW